MEPARYWNKNKREERRGIARFFSGDETEPTRGGVGGQRLGDARSWGSSASTLRGRGESRVLPHVRPGWSGGGRRAFAIGLAVWSAPPLAFVSSQRQGEAPKSHRKWDERTFSALRLKAPAGRQFAACVCSANSPVNRLSRAKSEAERQEPPE